MRLITLFVLLIAPAITRAQNIVKFEYFFDTDPGYGLGTPAAPSAGPTVTDFQINIPVSVLTSGFHRIYARALETSGTWTPTVFYEFYIATPDPSSGIVTAVEYFVDTDPGFGAGTAVAITPAANLSNVAVDVSASALPEGFHNIFVRSKNASGVWSDVRYSNFYVAKVLPPANVVKFEYFFDTDPGFDNGTAAPVTPPAATVTDQTILAVPSALALGQHTIFIRAKDSSGNWTSIVSQGFLVGPPTPFTTDGSGCFNTAIAMAASGATGTQQYRWYDVASGGTSLSGAASYAPVLTATTTYYVSIYDAVAAIESARSTVTATVIPLPPTPAITVGGPVEFCPGGSVTLNASTGFSGYLWSDGDNNGTRSASIGGSYTVQVTDATGCKSDASDAVLVTVFTPPAKPAITGSADICNGKTAELSGPAGYTYVWSDNESTQSIAVMQAATITLVVKDANGCSSPVSDTKNVTCANVAPSIAPTDLTTSVDGTVTFDLLQLLSDPDDNIDPSTLTVKTPPASGASATIDGNEQLTIDYKGISFSGTDHLTIGVCDLDKACTSQILSVEVAGDITVFNGVSANGDQLNPVFFIQYIDVIQETQTNKVTIYNRWGDVVFTADNYNNTTRAFRGTGNNGDALPSGVYFYKIAFTSGRTDITGYLSLKR